MAKSYHISEAMRRTLSRVIRKIDTLSGPGVVNTPDTVVIRPSQPVAPTRAVGSSDDVIWVQTTAVYSDQVGYAFKRMLRSPDGKTLTAADPVRSGDHAFEANGRTDVPIGTNVSVVGNGVIDGTPYLVFDWPGGRSAVVRIDAAASGGGKYTGYVVTHPTVPISPSGNLSESELGSNGAACLILDAAESGQATHDLTNGTPVQKTFIGHYLCMSDEETPRPVYMINGFDMGCE